MTSVARFSQSGDMNVRGEITQIPEELRGTGGRNLFNVIEYVEKEKDISRSGTYSLTKDNQLQVNYVDSRGSSSDSYKYFIELDLDTDYVMSYDVSLNMRFYGFNRDGASSGTSFVQDGNSFSFNTGATMSKLAMKFYPTATTYPVVIPYIKLEKGKEITPWTRSPEELGFRWIPNWVHNFDTPVSYSPTGDMAVSGELTEVPAELRGTGGRNLLDDGYTERTSSNEFLRYADMAPLLDRYGEREYTISFDIKAPIAGGVNVYCQNGTGARYSFSAGIQTTTEYTRQSVTVKPMLVDIKTKESFLAFYATYGTGRKPTVKNVKIEIGENATPWAMSPEDMGIDWFPDTLLNFNSPITVLEQTIRTPSVLVGTGGRNLYQTSMINNLALNGDSVNGNIVQNSAYRGLFIPVTPGEVYSIFRESATNNRFRCVFTSEEPKSGGQYFGGTGGAYDSNTKIEGLVAPNGAAYLFLYLSNDNDGVPNIKIEKGPLCTPWAPSPEEIGVNGIPTQAQDFNKPLALIVGKYAVVVGGEVSEVSDAISFNGTNQYIDFPSVIQQYLHGLTEATVEFWTKQNTLTGSDGYGFFQLSGYKNANGNLYPYNNPKVAYLDTFRNNRLGPITMPKTTGEWHHFAVTAKAGNNGWSLYQDGTLVYSTTGQETISTDYLEFRIGVNSGNRYAHAFFKEIRVWVKCRTSEDIKNNMSRSLRGDEEGLYGYWKLNEGYGSIAFDSTPNANHGTIVNGPEWIYTLDTEGGNTL